MLNEAFERFAQATPATVMVRGTLENILSASRLNALFDDAATVQYTRELTFHSVVRLMSQVVMRIRPSVNAAYRQQAVELDVTAKCVYDKLRGIEPHVSRELVRRTARELEIVLRALGVSMPSPLPGYRVRILDGNHLAGTDRRLKVLRGCAGAALPGQALALLDPALKLVVDLFPCEDAHAQERSQLEPVLDVIELGDLLIADRNFCTRYFLFGISRRQAAFLIRQHGNLPWEALGEPVYIGEQETGQVWEQPVRVINDDGQELTLRRISIRLHTPTRDGDTELHLLTNVPAEHADAVTLARLYADRWQVETAFQELTVDLCCEVSTLGYPKAALFAFSVAVLCYNALSVTKSALSAAQAKPLPVASPVPAVADTAGVASRKPVRSVEKLSTYYLADEIAGTWRGMMIMLPEPFWIDRFADLTPCQLADTLKDLASRAKPKQYHQRPPSPKGAKRKRSCQPGSHVSTAKVLKNGHQTKKR